MKLVMIVNIDILNTKTIIDDKVIFPKEDITKAGMLDMDEVTVKGKLDENYYLTLNIKGKMILPCSLTLKPTDYPFDINVYENVEEICKKNQKTIDILPIIWENILMEIPMKVVNPDSKNMKTKGDGWELIKDSEDKGNYSLAKLKDLL